MSSKRNIFLVIFILVLFSASAVFANEFSGSLTYSGEYTFTSQKLNNTLNLDLNYTYNFTDKVFAEGDLLIRYSDKSPSNPLINTPILILL
jgi:hypothetical protein